MREIKFRAWSNNKKEMIYSLHPTIKNTPVWNSRFFNRLESDPDNYSEVMQFTGRLDKNGTEIYASDKIKWYASDLEEYLVGEVFFNESVLAWVVGGSGTTNQKEHDWDFLYLVLGVEVIGNIYSEGAEG